MKNCFLALTSALALAACSSSTTNSTTTSGTSGTTGSSSSGNSSSTTGTTGSGAGSTTSASATAGSTGSVGTATTGASNTPTFEPSGVVPCTTSGCTTITFTNVDVHPAAKAALASIGFPVPNIASGSYGLTLQGVGIDFSTLSAKLTGFGTYQITSNAGPYAFSISADQSNNDAPLGVIGGIQLIQPDGGAVVVGDGGFIPEPTCAQWAGYVSGAAAVLDGGGNPSLVGEYLLDAGFTDYLVPSGLAVEPYPQTTMTGAIAYADPLSYVMMLNCAGSATKATRDIDQGIALVYAVDSTGAPISGVSYTLQDTGDSPIPTYYTNHYSATATAATDPTGIGTFLNVTAGLKGFGTVSGTDSANDTFTGGAGGEIATNPNTVFNVILTKQ